MNLSQSILPTALISCFAATTAIASDGQTFPTPLQACLHHNSSFFNENSEADCFGLDNLSGGESHELSQLPFKPGSINAGPVVDQIVLYDNPNFQGESCTVNSGSFSGDCDGADWRWRAESVKLIYGQCRLIQVEAPYSLSANLVATPATRTVPIAMGRCDDNENPLDNSGIYNRLVANAFLDADVQTRKVCTASDGIPQTFEVTVTNTDTGDSSPLTFEESVPRFATCANRPVF